MAVGDYGNNNGANSNGNNNKMYENTYYSRLKIKNSEENLCLNISFRSGLLILEITELQKDNGFKYETLETIYLSPTKAKLLAAELVKLKVYMINANEIQAGKAFGVNAGMGEKVSYIGFHLTNDKTILVTIGKIDGGGNIIEQATMNLNYNYHFALEWEDINNMDLKKVYDNNLEIDQIYELLMDFSRSMNGAAGYSAIDLGRYDLGRVLKKMDPIYDKLGIERRNSGSNNYGNRTNNFLENSGSTNSNSTTIEDIEDIV